MSFMSGGIGNSSMGSACNCPGCIVNREMREIHKIEEELESHISVIRESVEHSITRLQKECAETITYLEKNAAEKIQKIKEEQTN